MNYNPDIHHRRSIRLIGYDYSQSGAYFVTVCTQNRECLLGKITDGEMVLNGFGEIVADEWIKTGEIRDEIELDAWVIMPNHFHGILVINVGMDKRSRGTARRAPTNVRRAPTNVRRAPTNARRAPTNVRRAPTNARRAPTNARRAPTNARRAPTMEQFGKPVSGSIPTIVRSFKSAVTKRINEIRKTPGAKLWQRNYYEHIIRNEKSLENIRNYIIHNPAQWEEDENNPLRKVNRANQ